MFFPDLFGEGGSVEFADIDGDGRSLGAHDFHEAIGESVEEGLFGGEEFGLLFFGGLDVGQDRQGGVLGRSLALGLGRRLAAEEHAEEEEKNQAEAGLRLGGECEGGVVSHERRLGVITC